MTARRVRLARQPAMPVTCANPSPGPQARRRLAAFVEAIPYPAAVVLAFDDDVEVIAGNSRFESYLEERRRGVVPDAGETFGFLHRRIQEVGSGALPSHQHDIHFQGQTGPRSFRMTLTRIEPEDDLPPLVLFTAIDQSDEKRIEKVLRRELLTDMLTALPNRAGFLEQVEALGGNAGPGGAILTVDLVRFSRINESLGSIAGDEIIITVARRIKSILRAGDLLGRVGGNEFAIHSATICNPRDAEQIAKRVRQALESPIRIASYSINVEAAVGCAVAQGTDIDTEELFRRAQAAVKRAKSSGIFEVFRANTLTEAQARFDLESRLREAIQNDGLTLQFQPFVALATGEAVGFEALARWTDSVLGVVPPGRFIPVAEESGLIVPLGRWALRETARQIAAWDAKFGGSVPLTFNVNLSPMQMSRDDVSGAVREALDGAGIDGSRLTIELTESALIADVEKTRRLLVALKAMDLTIAMDDFGTGFSNLANLQTLPIDVLKIDRSFVTGMVGDRDKVAIVRAILSLASALGMRTIAEGIETEEVGRALAELGCDRGQGYYYARPMNADDAYAYWRERHRDSN